MTHEEFNETYNDLCWETYCNDNQQMTEDDAIRFWADHLLLMPPSYMTKEQVLYALTRYYKGDETMAMEAYNRRIKEAKKYKGSISDLDYLIP